ncbi:SDR family NAD(P)-dependent oxidoreductase [Nocardia sp. CA2R105]|uniref:SDR family NAD(P)-dependent oxidoreductase n=1 Tax=Nocardia coffeae TaxID=2873381 RepID=UPI001CA691C5|nr:SDR family NAD(P)-dependent oxidoreductase [Nocardia coffeae]MBY8857186.1 SDR family NAD(P)-dependent oxidoreductase [Nocardia coffeae]
MIGDGCCSIARMTRSRPLALVTGASSGNGFEIADQLQKRACDLIVAAENTAIGTAVAALTGNTEVRAIQADLRTAAGIEHLYAAATENGLAAVALNAGSAAVACSSRRSSGVPGCWRPE